MEDSLDLSGIEFADRLLRAAADPGRIATLIAAVIGDTIEVGPLPLAPGGLVSAAAVGRAREVRVIPAADDYRVMAVRAPILLGLRVQLLGMVARYSAIVSVSTEIRLIPRLPCALSVEIAPVRGEQITTRLYARDALAKVIRYAVPVEALIESHVARYVNTVLEGPEVLGLRHIDVAEAIERAWDSGLLLSRPTG
ncbi:hypothetical protein [Nocardia inohanensis]|uniref:hypothetical protein n=1 Tax=Nocardia inohanensis TaxID=209246 RepID=UPI000A6088E7|nr:hypothetical protein [Nocardia inohanensis]